MRDSEQFPSGEADVDFIQ